MSSLFHSLTVEGINDELVIESLQKGTIKLSPFRKGYIVVQLEKLKLDAARIGTGLTIFIKSEYLYAETGWETLSERRYRRKLQLIFNIKCGMAPEYLRHLVPPTIQSTTIYPLRNGDNLIVPFCRLSITNSSFIPSISNKV
jgi:hypothetical protein